MGVTVSSSLMVSNGIAVVLRETFAKCVTKQDRHGRQSCPICTPRCSKKNNQNIFDMVFAYKKRYQQINLPTEKSHQMSNDNLIKELQRLLPESASYGKFWIYKHLGTAVNSQVNKPGKLDAMAIIICSKGEMEITCNFRKFRLTDNCVFISQPHNMLSLSVTENFEGYIMATVEQGLSEYTIDPKYIPELLDKVYDTPLIVLEDDECSRICKAMDMISEYIKNKSESPFKSSIIKSALSTFAYLIAETLYSHLPSIEYEQRSIKREKEHFNRFLKLLSENYIKQKEVSWYADAMSLTPRYLTTTIRKVSGLTVSEWICQFIIKDAKYLLKHTEMTVQQVAYELNFPNQSFFGKYFKKNTGMSPGNYRSSTEE